MDKVEYLDPQSINGLNLYVYCVNNPVMYFDPSGKLFKSIKKSFNEIVTMVEWLIKDIKNFNINNTSKQVVINVHFFSYYKGTPVIKHYIKHNDATSCSIFGVMFINNDISKLDRGIDTIKHEYGHIIRKENMANYYILFLLQSHQ